MSAGQLLALDRGADGGMQHAGQARGSIARILIKPYAPSRPLAAMTRALRSHDPIVVA